MVRRLPFVLALFLLAAGPVWAETAKPETVRTFLQVAGMYQQRKLASLQQVDVSVPQQLAKDGGAPKELWPIFREEFVRELETPQAAQEYEKAMIPVYQKFFSDEELQALIAFHKTPAGSKWAKVRQEMMPMEDEAGKNWAKGIMSRVQPRVQKRLEPQSQSIPLQPETPPLIYR